MFLAIIALFPLPGNTQPPWPKRYDHNVRPDTAEAIAIDVRGNVYIAGTCDTQSFGKNVVVISYTAIGGLRTGWLAPHLQRSRQWRRLCD